MFSHYFAISIVNIVTPATLLAMVFGVASGIVIGALPGLSSTMGVALLLPLTFGMEPSAGLPMLMGIYCGAMYGGSLSAILIHTPGTAAAAATCLDGYPMAQRGEANKAIKYSLFASFCGGIFSAFVLLFLAAPLSRISLLLGPPEYFFLAILGLTLIGTLASKSWIKGLLSGFLGLFLATVGMDPILGMSRFTFGAVNLLSGINIIVALIGVFSLSQAFIMIEKEQEKRKVLIRKNHGNVFTDFLPKISELKGTWITIIRSSVIGTVIGMIPGTGGDLASWVGYNEAKRCSKNSDKFGTGVLEGVVAAEAANNGVTGGALVPVLALGIPGSATTAVLLGGFLVHGLRPGPRFLLDNAEISYTLIISLFFINLLLLVMGSFFGKWSSNILKLKNEILAPIIIILSVIGTYSISNSMFDVQLMLFFGFLGYIMRKKEIPTAPLVLGLILGPMAERALSQSLLISSGSWGIFVSRPVSVLLFGLTLLSLGSAILKDIKGSKKKV